MQRHLFTIPNCLSLLRIGLVPVILILAWYQSLFWLICFFFLALATDVLDGLLARILNQCTDLGRALDSWADFSLYITSPLIIWWAMPSLAQQEWLGISIMGMAFSLPVLFGFLKYRRLTMYHTWLAKLMGWSMGLGSILLAAGFGTVLFRFAIYILLLSAIEEITITLLLPVWKADIPTVWHALRFKNREQF